jgi:hypothetical protein
MSKEFRRWVTAFPIEHGNTQLCWPLALVWLGLEHPTSCGG